MVYSAFGVPTVWLRGDFDLDGDADLTDFGTFGAAFGAPSVSAPNYNALADFDADGDVDLTDFGGFGTGFGSSSSPGTLTGSFGNPIGYGGSVYDGAVGLWCMRMRWYDAGLGRWLTRDPAGYVDGMSLYLYALGNPYVYFDPMGLAWQRVQSDPIQSDPNGVPIYGLMTPFSAIGELIGERGEKILAATAAGAASGAAGGALTGSIVPGAGTAAGAGIGAIEGGIEGFFIGLTSPAEQTTWDAVVEATASGFVSGALVGPADKVLDIAGAGMRATRSAEQPMRSAYLRPFRDQAAVAGQPRD